MNNVMSLLTAPIASSVQGRQHA